MFRMRTTDPEPTKDELKHIASVAFEYADGVISEYRSFHGDKAASLLEAVMRSVLMTEMTKRIIDTSPQSQETRDGIQSTVEHTTHFMVGELIKAHDMAPADIERTVKDAGKLVSQIYEIRQMMTAGRH